MAGCSVLETNLQRWENTHCSGHGLKSLSCELLLSYQRWHAIYQLYTKKYNMPRQFKASQESNGSHLLHTWIQMHSDMWMCLHVFGYVTAHIWVSRLLRPENMKRCPLLCHAHTGAYRLAGKCGNSVFQKEKERGLRHTHTHTHVQPVFKLLWMHNKKVWDL